MTRSEKYKYDVFGTASIYNSSLILQPSALFGNRFLFTGREWIGEIGVYDYRNRVYSPDLGRFLQTDPIRFDAGDINIYRYCGNNPIQSCDPFGLADELNDPLLGTNSFPTNAINENGNAQPSTAQAYSGGMDALMTSFVGASLAPAAIASAAIGVTEGTAAVAAAIDAAPAATVAAINAANSETANGIATDALNLLAPLVGLDGGPIPGNPSDPWDAVSTAISDLLSDWADNPPPPVPDPNPCP